MESEYIEKTISSLCIIISSGGTPSRQKKEYYADNGIPWLKTKELRDSNVYNTEEFITELGLQKSSAKIYPINTVVMAMYGATVGQLGIMKKEMSTNQACCCMVVNENIADYRFLFYSLLHKRIHIINLASGAAQQNLNAQIIKDFKLNMPSLKTQHKIASILGSLDDKIELNKKMNQTLEKMAGTIFKEWFEEFNFPDADDKAYKTNGGIMHSSELGDIPDGWEVKNLESLSDIASSKRVFMSDYVEKGIPFYRSKEVILKSNGKNINNCLYISNKKYEEIKSKYDIPKKGEILLTSVGTLGIAYLIQDEEFYFKDGNLTWFKNFKYENANLYIYIWLKYAGGKKSLDEITIGSTQKALTISALKNIKIVFSKDIINEFSKIVVPILNTIQKNQQQTQTLTKFRDTLLPKLMSGEVKV